MMDDRWWKEVKEERHIPKEPSHFQWITACPCCGRILSPVDMAHECKCGQLLYWGSVNG